jgi:hypothetical protein
MTEMVRFEMNVPAQVALKDAGPGKPIEGRYGNRVMYTLADDRVMYVAPIVASRIADLGIQSGEPFLVRKRVKKQGSRRLIEWDVERLLSEPETQLERELRESIAVTQAAKGAQPVEAGVEPEPQLPPATDVQTAPSGAAPTATVPVSNDSRDGSVPPAALNGSTSPTNSGGIQEEVLPPTPPRKPVGASTTSGSASGIPSSAQRNGNPSPPVTTKLEHALKTAISAAYNAEKYGAELGYVVRFDADAIKSMAITVLINMSEGGRR